ncbi:MAG: 2-amino-4-hydroxy-6-hydroxymethyldihydropteridine diphosphokinase [Bacteroidales bacterium]
MIINKAYLLLGGDKGDRLANIKFAITRLASLSETTPLVSDVYESDPWGFDSNLKFLNVAAIISTKLDSASLLIELHEIEKDLGRIRDLNLNSYTSREMDVDIIFFNNDIVDNEKLTIPHPRMHLRRFVLTPLSQIAPQYVHPVINKSIKELLDECPDKSTVAIYTM